MYIIQPMSNPKQYQNNYHKFIKLFSLWWLELTLTVESCTILYFKNLIFCIMYFIILYNFLNIIIIKKYINFIIIVKNFTNASYKSKIYEIYYKIYIIFYDIFIILVIFYIFQKKIYYFILLLFYIIYHVGILWY